MGYFKDWANRGFSAELVPLMPGDSLSGQTGKIPLLKDWPNHVVTQSNIATWDFKGYNCGLRTRHYHCIDVDVEDEGLASTLEEIAFQLLGVTAVRRREGTARRALLYRLDGPPMVKRTLKFTSPAGEKGQIEFLGSGQQFMVAGLHHSGKQVTWENLSDAQSLVPMSEAVRGTIYQAFADKVEDCGYIVHDRQQEWAEKKSGGGGTGEPFEYLPAPMGMTEEAWHATCDADDQRKLEEALPRISADDYDPWVVVGLALRWRWPELTGTGFMLWDDWSARSQSYPGEAALAAKWKSFLGKNYSYTLGTIFYLAGPTPNSKNEPSP